MTGFWRSSEPLGRMCGNGDCARAGRCSCIKDNTVEGDSTRKAFHMCPHGPAFGQRCPCDDRQQTAGGARISDELLDAVGEIIHDTWEESDADKYTGSGTYSVIAARRVLEYLGTHIESKSPPVERPAKGNLRKGTIPPLEWDD